MKPGRHYYHYHFLDVKKKKIRNITQLNHRALKLTSKSMHLLWCQHFVNPGLCGNATAGVRRGMGKAQSTGPWAHHPTPLSPVLSLELLQKKMLF